MKTKLLFTSLLLFCVTSFVSGQVPYTKKHLSFNANEFSQIFTSHENNSLDLTYRVAAIDSSHVLRLATSFGFSTVDDEISHFAVRIGIDNVYKEVGNWKFYNGLDVGYRIASINDSERSTSRIGLIPFLGFLYHIGPHFSISTEPSIGIFRETEKRSANTSDSEFRLSLLSLGQIRIGFHF